MIIRLFSYSFYLLSSLPFSFSKMDTARTGGSQNTRDKMKGVARQWEGQTDDGNVVGLEYAEVEKKKKKGSPRKGTSGKESMQPSCQVDNCTTDMTFAKPYHRRHKVCPFHDKIPVAVVAGLRQRFCQQCSRFHELSEFDETKKSCRKRLAGHNERRRKCSSENGEGSG